MLAYWLGLLGSSCSTPRFTPPRRGFGDQEFYPDFVDKAAVLAVRISRNHPLPESGLPGRR